MLIRICAMSFPAVKKLQSCTMKSSEPRMTVSSDFLRQRKIAEQARKNFENICRVDVSDFKQRAFGGFPRYSLEAAFLAEQPAQRKNGTNSQEYLENSRGDQMLICLFFYKQIPPCRIAFTRIFRFFV